jgi:hypothetical protein
MGHQLATSDVQARASRPASAPALFFSIDLPE